MSFSRLGTAGALMVALLAGARSSSAQSDTSTPARQAPATAPGGAPPAPAAKDAIGRDTPRGTLMGFIRAAREGHDEAAVAFLNTNLRGKAAVDLARKLYVVLDTRLPARLAEVSDRPEGGLANPLKPDLDVVGTISTAGGPTDIFVERVNRGAGPIWLFSRSTLDSIPDVYDEIDRGQARSVYPPRADEISDCRRAPLRLDGSLRPRSSVLPAAGASRHVGSASRPTRPARALREPPGSTSRYRARSGCCCWRSSSGGWSPSSRFRSSSGSSGRSWWRCLQPRP